MKMGYCFKHITSDEANRFVNQFHRHNKKTNQSQLCIGLLFDDELIGVVICGRPVSITLDDGNTIEILRVCVKLEHKNANSKIYGRVRRICQLLGYSKIITYTLQKESQSSLLAIGAVKECLCKPSTWDRPNINRRRTEQAIYKEPKIRWSIPCESLPTGFVEKERERLTAFMQKKGIDAAPCGMYERPG